MMDIEMASPVGPMVGAAVYDENGGYGIPAELDLCDLLRTMSLSRSKSKVPETDPPLSVPPASQSVNVDGVNTPSDVWALSSSNLNSFDKPPQPSTPVHSQPHLDSHPHTGALQVSPPLVQAPHPTPLPGCHFLQSILASLAPASLAPASPALSPCPYPYPAVSQTSVSSLLQTTNGAYLDTILTHRALLGAFPPAHRGCATTLREIARELEVRAWRADREGDAEAVAALRQEAYLTSTWV